jgi:hypothetical protein
MAVHADEKVREGSAEEGAIEQEWMEWKGLEGCAGEAMEGLALSWFYSGCIHDKEYQA